MEKGLLFLYISPLFISAVLGIILVIFITRNRHAPGTWAMVALVLGASLWSIGDIFEFLSPVLTTKIFWAKFEYFGIVTIPLAWVIFTFQHMSPQGWLVRWWRNGILLGIIPAITLILVWTNGDHGLVWRQEYLLAVGSVQILGLEHGPWFWFYLAYGYYLLLWGSVRLVGGLLGSVRLYRRQIGLVLLAVLIPWVSNLVYITGLNPIPYLDWTPFSFTIAGLLLSISLFRFQLVNILPIAQRMVFAGQADCLFVLDLQDCIVELNPAAKMMIGNPVLKPVGKPLVQVMPELAGWVKRIGYDEEFQVEFSLGREPDLRFYDLHIAPLTGSNPNAIGRLLVLHEITLHKQEQTRLERARMQLEEIIAERTAKLRLAVEQLQRELTQRTLAEKRFADMVESGPDAMLLIDQAGTIILVNARAEQMFGYSREELLGQNVECLIPMSHRDTYASYMEQLIDNPSGRQNSFGLNLSALKKDGSEFPLEISLGTLRTEDSFWVTCDIRDISDRMKAEQAQTQLVEELKQSREQLQALTYRLQEVQEYERRQVSAELHDRIGQNLTGLNLNLQIIENQLGPKSDAAVLNRLEDSLNLVEETTRQVRDVMADLHPPMLDEYGLVSALHWYSSNFSQRTGINTKVTGNEFRPRLAQDVEMALFRLVQEALNNVAKHAQATKVEITVESVGENACLIIQDNGLGFDPQARSTPGDQPHWGLINMQQRVASFGGQLTIDSAPGQGTQISVCVRRG